MDPIPFIPSSLFFIFETSFTIGHSSGFTQCTCIDTLFTIGIHNLLVRDKESIRRDIGISFIVLRDNFSRIHLSIKIFFLNSTVIESHGSRFMLVIILQMIRNF
mmetsp:Transcript_4595/g.12890  ORF Transcript_4595/g.12890 Transcript_4595/m.12890 type:complete len:104 (-) Transcript_4595:646-957(-)